MFIFFFFFFKPVAMKRFLISFAVNMMQWKMETSHQIKLEALIKKKKLVDLLSVLLLLL